MGLYCTTFARRAKLVRASAFFGLYLHNWRYVCLSAWLKLQDRIGPLRGYLYIHIQGDYVGYTDGYA